MTKFLSRNGVEVKVGDKVVIVAKWAERENGMGKGLTWRNSWVGGNMDRSVGNVVEVKRIDSNGVYFEGAGYWAGYGFPAMSVEHFEAGGDNVSQYTFFDTRSQARATGKQVYDATITGTTGTGRWFVKT